MEVGVPAGRLLWHVVKVKDATAETKASLRRRKGYIVGYISYIEEGRRDDRADAENEGGKHEG